MRIGPVMSKRLASTSWLAIASLSLLLSDIVSLLTPATPARSLALDRSEPLAGAGEPLAHPHPGVMTGARIQRDAGATTSMVSAGSGPLQAAPVSSYATSAAACRARRHTCRRSRTL